MLPIVIAACLDRNSERIDFEIRKAAKDKGYSLKNPIPLTRDSFARFVAAGTALISASPLCNNQSYAMRRDLTFLFNDDGSPVVLAVKSGDILRVFRR